MAIDAKPGQTLRVTVKKTINRDSARKTIERLFMKDKAVVAPLDRRSRNFIELPKRRGGVVWTKRCNKIHPELKNGAAATILATPQALRDLKSVESFLDVTAA